MNKNTYYSENNSFPFKPQFNQTLKEGNEEKNPNFSLWVAD